MMKLVRAICPYPHLSELGELCDGYQIGQPRACGRCEPKACAAYVRQGMDGDVVLRDCPKGFSVVALPFGDEWIVCNGLLVTGIGRQHSPQLRKDHRSQKAKWREVSDWHRAARRLLVAAGECVDEEARELILGLHDVSTAVSLVTRNAEVVIDGYPGETDYEKIENSPAHIKRLLKSVSLLRTRLSMSSIVANPDSASFGEKHPIPVYKVFDRMVRLFEEIAAQKGVHIQIVGPSFAKPDCYDSFDTLALVLIDNAVKYSFGRHHIKVVVKDKSRDAVKVRVESYGPIVPRDMREQIFKRGVRTRVAEESCSKGSGLGLYIARVVASAHGFGVEYKAIEGDRSSSEGWNVFSFEL